jgi:hypothetical protein
MILGVMAMGSVGCLITERPDFPEPQQTPPFLTNLDPTPATAQFIEFEPGTDPSAGTYKRNKSITFNIVSEDLGEALNALVVINFKGLYSPTLPSEICRFDKIAPGTLDTKRDPFSCQLDLNRLGLAPDCYSVAVVVSHDFLGGLSVAPAKQGDIAVATWFYQVGVNPADPNPKYMPCKPAPEPADAGIDARLDGGGP